MNNLSILRHALKLNADVITMLDYARLEAKDEASLWKGRGETAYFIAACEDVAKYKRKIAKAVEMQRRTKVEIVTFFRKERIKRKYLAVFGKLPEQQINTTYEQEAMLGTLLAEKAALGVTNVATA